VPLGAASAASQMWLGRLPKRGRLGRARRCVARNPLNAVREECLPGLSEKPCLGCNGMSRIIGLEEIVMCCKPLAGRLIWAYKPSQAVIGLVIACKELPKVQG
jgi:hypothetical protein